MKRQVYSVWFFIFIAWAFYRSKFFFPEWVDELIVKPVIFALPVIYIVIIREKNKFKELGVPTSLKDMLLDLYIGVVIGILFAFEGLLANYLKYGNFSFSPIDALKISGGVPYFLLLNLATSIWEEILARGYLYKRLYKISKNQLWAATHSSFFFLLLHIPIMFTKLHLTGTSLIVYPVSILILGITNCYIFSYRKTLTLPILIHTFWNMTVALYL